VAASVVVCKFDELPDGQVKRFMANGKAVAIVRFGEEVYAISDTCSHANYALSEGEVFPDERSIECFKHGSAFSLRTGMAMNLPATRPVPVYEVERRGDEIAVVIP